MARILQTLPRILLLCTFAACSNYTPAPLKPAELLQGLRDRQPVALPTGGLSPEVAVATALVHNPELLALRQDIGIADSLLLEAGLWPDLNLGWDAMDWIIGGTRDDALSGLSAMIPLFRPDERDALVADAEAGLDFVHAQLLTAEWKLARIVREQYLELAEAQSGLDLAQQAQEVAQQTTALLRDGLASGGATRFDLEMALIQEAEGIRRLQSLHRQIDVTRMRLNALMGLAPGTAYLSLPLSSLDERWLVVFPQDAATLVDQALNRRPDLKAHQAEYAMAEASLRREVASQWPELVIGTGISLRLPLFRRFNQQGIRTAALRRDQASARLEVAIANLRSQAWQLLREAQGRQAEWASVRERILPALERSLSMSHEAQGMGALSFLEVLFAQRQLLSSRREALAAHANALRAQADLAWFLGPAKQPEDSTR